MEKEKQQIMGNGRLEVSATASLTPIFRHVFGQASSDVISSTTSNYRQIYKGRNCALRRKAKILHSSFANSHKTCNIRIKSAWFLKHANGLFKGMRWLGFTLDYQIFLYINFHYHMQYNTLKSKVAIRMAVGKNSSIPIVVLFLFKQVHQFLWT